MPLIEPYKDYGQTPVEAFGFHWLTRTDAWHPGGPAANQKWNERALRKRPDGSLEISISAVGGEPMSAEISSSTVAFARISSFCCSFVISGILKSPV